MLLPNWGLRVSSVETTQEALDRVRTAANQGKPWAYSVVLADLPGIRNTAVALHRNISRSTIYGDLRLVCLYGEDPVPDELQRKVTRSEENTSELQSLMRISYAVFCLKNTKQQVQTNTRKEDYHY